MAQRKLGKQRGKGCVTWRKDRGAWYVRFYDSTGKRYNLQARVQAEKYSMDFPPEVFNSKTKGRNPAREVLAESIRRNVTDSKGTTNGAHFSALVSRYLKYQATRNTAGLAARTKLCLDHILSALNVERVCDLRPQHIEAYQAARLEQSPPVNTKRTISRRTVNLEVGTLRALLRWALGQNLVKSNPMEHTRPLTIKRADRSKIRRALSTEEIRRLFEKSQARYSLIWKTFLGTGLRLGELSEITWSDLNTENGSLTIRAELTKTGDSRIVPLNPELQRLLLQHRDTERRKAKTQRRNPHDRIFCTASGRSLYGNLLRAFYASLTRAEICPAGLDIHSLRGTWITHAIDSGMNPKHVQYVAGHRTFSVTMDIYYKFRPEALFTSATTLPYFQPAATPTADTATA